jgi:hypothetical protein
LWISAFFVCVRLVRVDQHVRIGQSVWTVRWLLPIIIVDLSDVHVFDHRELLHLRGYAGLWMVSATTTHLSLLIASHWFPTRGYSSHSVLLFIVVRVSCVRCGDGHTSHQIGSAGSCVSTVNGYSSYCSTDNLAVASWKCSSYPSGPGGGGASSDNPGPSAAQSAGIVLMTFTGLIAVILISFYSFLPQWRPKLGSRYQLSQNLVTDFTRPALRIVPLVFLTLSLLLKLTALGLDRWGNYPSDGFTVIFGLLTERASIGSSSMSYIKLCENVSYLDPNNTKAICTMLISGAILTLIFSILSLLFQVIQLVCMALMLWDGAHVSRHVMKCWRLAGLTTLCTFALVLEWLFGPYFGLHHTNGSFKLDVSWILMCPAFFLDFGLILFYRRAVQSTPDPARGIVASAVAIPAGAPFIANGGITQAYPAYPTQSQSQYAVAMVQPQGVAYAYPISQGGFAPVQPVVYMSQPYQPVAPQPQQQAHVAQGFAAPPAENPGAYQPLKE